MNVERPYDVLVIGAGPAGTRAALRAAELGATVAVAEAAALDGMCVNTGCVPTRVLAKTARITRELRGAGAYGIDVSPPSVVWERTVERTRQVVSAIQASKDTAGALARSGAHLLQEGRARFVGPHTVELAGTGRRVEAEQVIICVGGHARRLPIPGAELAVVPEHVLDLPAVPDRMAIVGSGATGVQLATIFDALGSAVILLESAPRVMPNADADVSRVLEASFRSSGIDVRTGITGASAVEAGPGDQRILHFTTPQGPAQLAADVVILCAGWPAALDGLGLDAAGVDSTGEVIPVNAYQQTNVPHIYAAGDVDGDAMLVQAAVTDAEAAATNAVMGPTREAPHALLPWGSFTDPDIAGVGLTEVEARQRDPCCLVATAHYAHLERAIIDDRTTGFVKLIADQTGKRLLGAHAVGESAVEVIQAVTTAMAAGADVGTLAQVEFAYPTYTAIVGVAARMLDTERLLGLDQVTR